MKKVHDDYTEYFFTNWLVKQASALHRKMCNTIFISFAFVRVGIGIVEIGTMGSFIVKFLEIPCELLTRNLYSKIIYSSCLFTANSSKKGRYLFHH